jgi:crossover junction endodeoxyribonuclease RusA
VPAKQITLTLPWPPTVNTYWRHVGGRVIVSWEGRIYRGLVAKEAFTQLRKPPCFNDRLAVAISAFPPDSRMRDLDNLLKATLDAMQSAGIYENDNLIDELTIVRQKPRKGGQLVVTVGPL